MSAEINEVPSSTPDFRTELAKKLAELMPEVVADGKIDLDSLRELLADDASTPPQRFGLFWPGKSEAIRAAHTPTTATLAPDRENSVDWDTTQNVFIEGDNLEVLKILQKHYYGKIKMIYIDPPYNTGKDFVYPDNYADPIGSYLEMTGQSDSAGKLSTNSESAGRFHSNWLSMIYPRIKLARTLMREDGIMFISIDEHEVHNLTLACQELFGADNVIGAMPVIMNLKGNQDKFGFADTHEFILVCLKNRAHFKFGKLPIDDETVEREWQIDEHGLYKQADNLRATGSNAPRSKRPNLWYPIFVDPQTRNIYVTSEDRPLQAGHEAVYPVNPKGEELSWYWKKSTFEENKHNLIVKYTSNGWQLYRKQRPELGHAPSAKPKSVLFSPKYSTSTSTTFLAEFLDGKVFDTPKPLPFIRDLFHIAGMKEGIVLDFFAGSGTTAHAALSLNEEDGGARRSISVQLPEPTAPGSLAQERGYETISSITRERIRRASTQISARFSHTSDADSVDVGFRAYKLIDTNFAKWSLTSDISAEELQQQLNLRADSSDDESLPEWKLTEILLKLGFSLNEKIEPGTIDGLNVFNVADGLVLAYTNEHVKPTLDQLRALVAARPEKLIVLEDVFGGNDELKTNLVQECRTHNVDLFTA